MDYKPNIDITQCTKWIFNDPFNLNINTPSSNFLCKEYGTPTTLPNHRKESKHVWISCNEVSRPEESHITSQHKEHYKEKQKYQLSNIKALICGKTIYIELSMSKKAPRAYVIIPNG